MQCKKKSTGLKRNNNEQYYTKEQISKQCIDLVHTLLCINSFDLIIEPSAGTGSFLKGMSFELLDTATTILAYDIDPKYDSIIEQDYLAIDPIKEYANYKKILVIGNPPFGRQSSLAKKFIKQSCLFANTVAFILPRSFKKQSMTTCFPMDFHKVHESELENDAFLYQDKDYSVPCVFQIWKKQESIRPVIIKITESSTYTITKTCTSDSTFAFRRVGVYAGKFIYTSLNLLSTQSHYFITYNKSITEDIQAQLNTIHWETNNTIGPKSISKQELIAKLNVILI